MSLKEEDERTGKPQPVGSSSNQPADRPLPNEGVFSQPNFAKTVTSLIGNNVKVKTKTGFTYEGIFTTFSPNFEVIIALSHEVDQDDPFYNKVVSDTIIFNSEDIVSISCVNVNLKEALDLSQRMEITGDFPEKTEPGVWEGPRPNDDVPYVDEGWTINHLRSAEQALDFGDSLKGYSFYSRSDLGKDVKIGGNQDEYMANKESGLSNREIPLHSSGDPRVEYPKPQRKPKFGDSHTNSDDFPEMQQISDKASNLNPYAKPFTPMDTPCDKETTLSTGVGSLATVVLPTYVVPSSTPTETARYGKSDTQSITGAPPSLLGTGSLQNQYMPYSPYGDGYDEKLYSSYDNLPLSAHEYPQYYPHLQYIQYFRRFY